LSYLSPQVLNSDLSSNWGNDHKYELTKKHARGGWGTEMDLDNDTAQEVLNNGLTSPNGRQVYGYRDSKIYEFQPGHNAYHGYPVPAGEVPSSVLKEFLDQGLITKSEYNRMRKNKE
jgi:hypothetical protein